jgi:hypothetical protein
LSRSSTSEKPAAGPINFQLVASLLDAVDRPLMVAERTGQLLFTNLHAQDAFRARGMQIRPELNLFLDILRVDRKKVLEQLEDGLHEVHLPMESAAGRRRARIRWLPEPDWLAVYIEPVPVEPPDDEVEMRETVQSLLKPPIGICWRPTCACRKPIGKRLFSSGPLHTS